MGAERAVDAVRSTSRRRRGSALRLRDNERAIALLREPKSWQALVHRAREAKVGAVPRSATAW